MPTIMASLQPRSLWQREAVVSGEMRGSKAAWKIWGNTTATLNMRADPQNLPAGLTHPWPGAGYAGFGGGDHSSAYVERAEIYDFVRDHGITGFATIAGDRHSFWAGSAPGEVEALEHGFPKQHALRPLFLGQAAADQRPQPTINMLLRHDVRSCLEYERPATSRRRVLY
jgi:alkaline phosphatase D